MKPTNLRDTFAEIGQYISLRNTNSHQDVDRDHHPISRPSHSSPAPGFFHLKLVVLALECHRYGIICSPSCLAYFIQHNLMILRFIHMIANISNLFFSVAEWYSPNYFCRPVFPS